MCRKTKLRGWHVPLRRDPTLTGMVNGNNGPIPAKVLSSFPSFSWCRLVWPRRIFHLSISSNSYGTVFALNKRTVSRIIDPFIADYERITWAKAWRNKRLAVSEK